MVKEYSYAEDGKTFLSPHFQVREFASKRGTKLYSDVVKIDTNLVDLLERLFEKLDCKYIVISSGYRTVEHDKDIGGSGKGYHISGQAADFRCVGKDGKNISAKKVCCALEDMKTWGIGYINGYFCHADTREQGKIWWGDETKSGSPSIWHVKEGCRSFYDYFGIPKPEEPKEEPKKEPAAEPKDEAEQEKAFNKWLIKILQKLIDLLS